MNVLIDASCLMKELTGIGVYVRDLLKEMIPLDRSVRYTVFLNALKGQTPVFEWQHHSNVNLVRRRVPGKVLLELWRRNYPPDIRTLAGCKPDLFHSPNFLYQRVKGCPIVTTVHDLAFLKRRNYGSRYSGDFHRQTLLQNLRRAGRFIVVSDAVAGDLVELCDVDPRDISVVHHGLNPLFKPAEDRHSIAGYIAERGYPAKYLLCVGTIEPRKNMPVLVKAFDKIAGDFPDLHLVFAGRIADGYDELEKVIRESDAADRIIISGYVDFNILIALYQTALGAVFPSWDEGFGFPTLEAASCGTPVFASDIKVHREILKDAAWFFKPDNAEDLANVLKNQLLMPENLESKREKGFNRSRQFNWKMAAEKHLNIYRSMIK